MVGANGLVISRSSANMVREEIPVYALHGSTRQEEPHPGISQEDFRLVMGKLVTGVTAVLCADPATGEPRGMTANGVVSLSKSPPIVGLAIGSATQSYGTFVSTSRFTVNILHRDQAELALRLAKSGSDKFDGLTLGRTPDGSPVLRDSLVSFECQTRGNIDIGDHALVIGEMCWVSEAREQRPALVFLGGGRFASAPEDIIDLDAKVHG